MTPDALANFLIIKAMGLDLTIAPDEDSQRVITATIRDNDVVIDALLGTGFRGEVRSPTSQLITALNAAAKRATVAIDVPSGLDCDSGAPSSTTIRADLTVTFVTQKAGFTSPSAKPYIGRVEVADIGAPRGLIAEVLTESA
jgi:NAD(P)H-hydrate epimerase